MVMKIERISNLSKQEACKKRRKLLNILIQMQIEMVTGIVTIHFKCLYCKRQKREKMTCEREQFILSNDSI